MIAKTAPMGWNSWNTFGENISDSLIRETADAMVEKGYLAAGYNYLVIDDCWALRDRDENGLLVPDPKKFPNGMKAVADYVHSKGLKFGMYSCAGVRTCAGYPSSYDHEFVDAKTFASWGVDFLKYDFCNFPVSGDCKNRYLTMSMALKASGREILFSACNWGVQEPWHWMRSVGVHMYRSTGDINDTFKSFTEIVKSQLPNFSESGNFCYNDIDMLTVGMYGKGNVGLGKACTDNEYRMQFALWCMLSAPLMMGGDIRSLTPESETLLKNKNLIAINQDIESRPPYIVSREKAWTYNPETKEYRETEDARFIMVKHMADNRFAIAFINMHDEEQDMQLVLSDAGLPYGSGIGFKLTDAFTDADAGIARDYHMVKVAPHDVKVFLAEMVQL